VKLVVLTRGIEKEARAHRPMADQAQQSRKSTAICGGSYGRKRPLRKNCTMTRLLDVLSLRRRFAVGLTLVAMTMTTASSEAGFVTFEAAGANPAAITPTLDAFRAELGGGSVAGANGSFGGLRREINWDGVPDVRADPNPLPADFFNVNSPRGVVFSTPERASS
jgi:hypothetical protein